MKKLLAASILCGLLLSGCGQSQDDVGYSLISNPSGESSKVDLSDYPEGVQNGTVSHEFYDQLIEWNKKCKTTVDQTLTANRKLGKELSYEEYSSRMKEIEVEWKLYNEKIEWQTITKADSNMYSTMSQAQYSLELALKYLSDSAKSYSDTDKNLAKSYSYEVDDTRKFLQDQMSSYNIID